MEGVKRLNPFYWVALHRFSRVNNGQNINQSSLSLRNHVHEKRSMSRGIGNLPTRAIRALVIAFFGIATPIYAYIGMQPVSSIEALSYPNLTISNINLETPVAALEMVDRELTPPATIAGSYSQNTNKTLIIGHSSTVFKKLEQVRLGNDIRYGEKEYIVTNVVTLEKDQVNMAKILAASDTDTLVLMTCAGEALPDQDATHRLIVTAQAKTE